MANRSKHETEGTAWNKTRQHISNDSSLGGDEFYNAVEDMSSRTQRVSGMSSVYGSNRSTRARSSSAGTLVPNAEAAELMKLVASTNSSVELDVSAFATAGEYAEEGPGGSSLALDESHGVGGSKNPFNEEVTGGTTEDASSAGAPAAAAETRRRWLSLGRLQPEKMVVDDISSAENTPVTTPVHAPGGGMGDGSISGGGISSASPLPPPHPPPRVETTRAATATTAASLNPFAEEPLSPTSPNTNPFVTASSTLNPFADDSLQKEGSDGGGGGEGKTGGQQEGAEEEAPLPSSTGGPGTVSAPNLGDAGVPVVVKPTAPAAAASSAESNPKKPPPLPPRRAASASPTRQQPPPSRTRSTTEARGNEDSGPVSRRSTASLATCDSGGDNLEGSERGADSASVGSSTGSDGITGGKSKKKYMVVNKVNEWTLRWNTNTDASTSSLALFPVLSFGGMMHMCALPRSVCVRARDGVTFWRVSAVGAIQRVPGFLIDPCLLKSVLLVGYSCRT